VYISGSFVAFIFSFNLEPIDVATTTQNYASSRCLHKIFSDDELHNDQLQHNTQINIQAIQQSINSEQHKQKAKRLQITNTCNMITNKNISNT